MHDLDNDENKVHDLENYEAVRPQPVAPHTPLAFTPPGSLPSPSSQHSTSTSAATTGISCSSALGASTSLASSPSSTATASPLNPLATPKASPPHRQKKQASVNGDVVDESQGVLSTPRKGWHGIKEIVSEGSDRGNLVYLIEWEGCDPKSGIMWPCSWVDAKDVSAGAIREWESRKATEAYGRMSS
ncbi:hypothetical protein DL764_005939 [Monosporascus ibericus]|uniref:Chromo domain-containing protein n=1 Tax=Monosporascus ibericus TaxID=155417 RepID=A0A4Q4T9G2_9PEZI|nr:hypothetical protein DL764_005939 [Monosporascus ibericus]